MRKFARNCLAVILLSGFVTVMTQMIAAQEPPTTPAQDRPAFPGASREPEIKPYDKVITKEAKSDEGIFTVHRIKDKVYYEIPKSQLGKEFLWVSQIAKTTLGVGYGGQALGNRVIKWDRYNNRIFLKSVSYEVVSDPNLPINKAVQAANNDTIIMSFFIEAFGKDEAPVIEVTRLFTTEVTEFSARTRLRARDLTHPVRIWIVQSPSPKILKSRRCTHIFRLRMLRLCRPALPIHSRAPG
ncbi:MAG: DUF5118 domain-containing protein [Acidobacteria bacterium]|nr:DUF5118 domain-containing protein [Acidobacteriota bacterium]